MAFATLPFDPGGAPSLIVPQLTVERRADGSARLTVVGDDDAVLDVATALAELAEPVARAASAGRSGSTCAHSARCGATSTRSTAARDAVRDGVDRQGGDRPRGAGDHASGRSTCTPCCLRLRASFGSSYRYCVDGLIGASPELLSRSTAWTCRSHPLAGTAPRSGDPDTDARAAAELVASTKDQVEHRVVIDTIYDTLLPHCSYLDWEPEPSVLTVANVQHLATRMEGRLSEPRPPAHRTGP